MLIYLELAELRLKIKKYEFYKNNVEFLKFVININGIRINLIKIKFIIK